MGNYGKLPFWMGKLTFGWEDWHLLMRKSSCIGASPCMIRKLTLLMRKNGHLIWIRCWLDMISQRTVEIGTHQNGVAPWNIDYSDLPVKKTKLHRNASGVVSVDDAAVPRLPAHGSGTLLNRCPQKNTFWQTNRTMENHRVLRQKQNINGNVQ